MLTHLSKTIAKTALGVLLLASAPAYAGSAAQSPDRMPFKAEALYDSLVELRTQLPPEDTFLFELDSPSFKKVDLTDEGWRASFRLPTKVNWSFSIYRGDIYITDYYRKNRYDTASMELLDDVDPQAIAQGQPYLSVDSNGQVSLVRSGGSIRILQSLKEANGGKVRLYRGASQFEAKTLRFMRDLLQTKASESAINEKDVSAFATLVKDYERTSKSPDKKKYVRKWTKFIKEALAKKPSVKTFASGAIGVFSGSHGGAFTTPSLRPAFDFGFGTWPGSTEVIRPEGSVIVFEVSLKDLKPEIQSQIYAGVENEYIEVGFMGPDARELLIRSLTNEIYLPKDVASKIPGYRE